VQWLFVVGDRKGMSTMHEVEIEGGDGISEFLPPVLLDHTIDISHHLLTTYLDTLTHTYQNT